MKKTLSVFVGLISFLAISHAAEDGLHGSLSSGIMSKYIGRIGVVFHESPISVNVAELNYKEFNLGIWNATSLSGRKYGSTYGDEWDLYGGWGHTFGPIKLSLSASYFGLMKLEEIGDDMWIAEQEISIEKFPFVKPYIRTRYFGSVGDDWKPGWFVFGGIRKSIEFGHYKSRRFSLNLDASTAYAAGALHDFEGFVYGRLTTSLDVPLSKRSTLSPIVIFQAPAPGQRYNPKGFTDGNQIIGGVNYRWTF